jgi:ADP-ribose pyrophosphatase YjhB (NUDIX family)
MGEPKKRIAIRAVIVAPDGCVLLMRMREPKTGREIWVTPGGGLNKNESHEACICRELYEETGLRDVQMGPCVWTRRHSFEWNGEAYEQTESFYLIHYRKFMPSNEGNPEAAEKSAFKEFRWWSVAEMMASTAVLAPRQFARYLNDLLHEGIPASSIDVGA